MMKYITITNHPSHAEIAIRCGVERIMIDLEYLDKAERQGHKDMFMTTHRIEDVAVMRKALPNAEIMVRVNPCHANSQAEIDQVIEAGASMIMLPMIRTVEEVEEITTYIAGRAGFVPLIEHIDALESIEEIAALAGIDELYLGLNDLHLSLNMHFLFEPLAANYVDRFAKAAINATLPFGFGGIGPLGQGTLPADALIKEHARLASTRVILSRVFWNHIAADGNLAAGETACAQAVNALSQAYKTALARGKSEVAQDREQFVQLVKTIIS